MLLSCGEVLSPLPGSKLAPEQDSGFIVPLEAAASCCNIPPAVSNNHDMSYSCIKSLLHVMTPALLRGPLQPPGRLAGLPKRRMQALRGEQENCRHTGMSSARAFRFADKFGALSAELLVCQVRDALPGYTARRHSAQERQMSADDVLVPVALEAASEEGSPMISPSPSGFLHYAEASSPSGSVRQPGEGPAAWYTVEAQLGGLRWTHV